MKNDKQKAVKLALSLLAGACLSPLSGGAIAKAVPIAPVASESTANLSESEAMPNEVIPGEAIEGDSEAVEGEMVEDGSEARSTSLRKGEIYSPIRLKSGLSIQDKLTPQDIPLGQGSFARDYIVTLKAKDQIAIDLSSDSFDTVVTLMGENGTTLGENDDGPDGGTNSLLFMRITKGGDYVVRVRGFGQAKGGPFELKLTRLEAVN